MPISNQEIKDYLNQSKTLVLATVNDAGEPDIRTLGGYGISEFEIYFATAKGSNKVKQLDNNRQVAVLFQHENQVIPDFINITLYGKAILTEGEDFKAGKEIILKRRPQNAAAEETHNIYRVKPEKIKVLNFNAPNPEERVYTITL